MPSIVTANDIIDYEDGELGFEDTVRLFQKLVDSGMAWRLQGHYGRIAETMIDEGLVRVTQFSDPAAGPYGSEEGVTD